MIERASELDSPADSVSCCGGADQGLSDTDARGLARDLSAVADPVRLQVLSILARSAGGEVCACDFVGAIGRSQPTISHHLKVLSEAGLVVGERRGRWVWYRLAPGRLDGLVDALTAAATPADE